MLTLSTMTDAIDALKNLRPDVRDVGLEDKIDWRAAVRAGMEGMGSNRYEDIDEAALERMCAAVDEQVSAL